MLIWKMSEIIFVSPMILQRRALLRRTLVLFIDHGAILKLQLKSIHFISAARQALKSEGFDKTSTH